MPRRRTLRGADRTPLSGDADVLVCGASFAGLAVARELAESGARVLVLDRYEIGERQTSACGIPTEWLRAMDLMGSQRQEFGRLVVHTPHGTARLELPWTFSTFDYPELCALLWEQSDADFETATVHGRTGDTVHTDRGDLTAPLVVDALGWRRVLGNGYQPPDAPLSRGLEVHPHGAGDEMEIWIDRRYVPAGYGWSFPAADELRIGVGSFDPRFHVKDTTVLLASWATRPATACRSRRRASARPSTSGSPAGASSAPSGRAGAPPPRRWRATATSPTHTGGSSARCCRPSGSCRGCRRGSWPERSR
jgi:flavin-dependent dehydrogenase